MASTTKSRFGLGCCLGMLGCGTLPIAGLIGLALLGSNRVAPSLQTGTTLEISLADDISEGPPQGALQELFGRETPSVWNIREALRAASGDPKISGVLLDIETVSAGLATVQELKSEIENFRASGKPVKALLRGDFAQEREYLLALAADEIFLVPEAGLLVNGYSAEVTFWRGTLDKLGVVPYVFMLKEYKSAGEPYSRTEMSDPFKESLQALLDDYMADLVSSISKRRGLDEQTARLLVDRGILTASEALQAKLVDQLGYRDQVEQFFIDKSHTPEFRSIEPNAYLHTRRKASAKDAQIAVLFGEGPIVASSEDEDFNPLSPMSKMIFGPKMAERILEAADDPMVKAIVLRINSPGGSPVGSDAVYRAIQKAQGRGKKVVISMSDVAASGGYWLSMGADKIVCQPLTLTGSIGVVFQKFDLTGLYKLVGANISKVKIGENSDLLSLTSDLEGARGEQVLASMTQVYENFTHKVAEGRKLPLEEVEKIARGRVWSGQDALERKLVDQLGGLTEAIDLARDLSGSKNARAVAYRNSKGYFREFMNELQSTSARAGLPDLRQIREAARPSIELLAPAVRIE